VDVIGRRDLAGKCQVPVQESSDVVTSRIVDGNDKDHASAFGNGTLTEATRKNIPLRGAAATMD
jgi:hypothetical protein